MLPRPRFEFNKKEEESTELFEIPHDGVDICLLCVGSKQRQPDGVSAKAAPYHVALEVRHVGWVQDGQGLFQAIQTLLEPLSCLVRFRETIAQLVCKFGLANPNVTSWRIIACKMNSEF